MPSLQDLKLSNKALGDDVSFDEIPAERGSFVPPPDPGSYRFALPKAITNFDTIVTEKYGERLNVIFDASAPLVIVQSPGKAFDGASFETRLSNVPRPRGKEKVLVSDADYLLKAKGVTQKPASNLAYAKAIQGLAEKDFGADVEWSWSCNPKRAARFLMDDGSQQRIEDVESTLDGDDTGFKAGCGARYYQNDVQKVEGKFPLSLTCTNPECGAQVRAFANLRNFKA